MRRPIDEKAVMTTNPSMRAMGYTQPGPPEVLHEVVVDRPSPLPTEILVRVHASGLNPIDWRTRAGAPTPAAMAQGGESVHVLGWDVSGVVEEVGAGVYLFEPGDEVYGLPWFPRPAGGNAEFVCAPSRQFAEKPKGIDHVHAAAVPLAGLTAWQALTDAASIQPGQRVLVHAAGGGVGHLAVQIAKARGAFVIGTASESKHEWLRTLGVDELVDYRSTRFEDVVEPVDVVLDLVGGFGGSDIPERSISIIKPGGTFVRVAPGTPSSALRLAAEASIRVTPDILVEPDGQGLADLARLVDSGALKVRVEEEFPLLRLADAHRQGELERTSGKLVIRVI